MTRFLPLLLLGALLVPLAPSATAQPTYTVAWPEGDPIWEMTIVRPSQSSGPDGGGLEIRDVSYNGRLVMKRGHVPVLNVKYEAGCNCFRDWQDAEVRFVADNPLPSPNNWVAEATAGTVQTMCDAAPANCSGNTCSDVGSHNGVAVERFDDRLVLTTHLSAGWYRYTMRWVFHEDGTIQPLFGFTSTGTACTTNPRRHHAFWRFDFDIEGAENDYVAEHRGDEVIPLALETRRSWSEDWPFLGNETAHGFPIGADNPPSWSVMDTETGRGYLLTPSEADLLTPMNPQTGIPALDDFAKEDVVVSLYDPSELTDGFSSCQARFEEGTNAVVNQENTYGEDVVLWYRSGVTKPHSDASTCYESGPILTPIGDWSPTGNNPVAGEDAAAPTGFTLENPYPNPFDGTTTVRFSVETAQAVTLTLFDGVGREIRTLYAGTPSAGAVQAVTVDGTDLPNGVYTVRLEGNGFSESKRITLVK